MLREDDRKKKEAEELKEQRKMQRESKKNEREKQREEKKRATEEKKRKKELEKKKELERRKKLKDKGKRTRNKPCPRQVMCLSSSDSDSEPFVAQVSSVSSSESDAASDIEGPGPSRPQQRRLLPARFPQDSDGDDGVLCHCPELKEYNGDTVYWIDCNKCGVWVHNQGFIQDFQFNGGGRCCVWVNWDGRVLFPGHAQKWY